MQYPTLAQLAKMNQSQRVARLRGIDKISREKLKNEAAYLLASLYEKENENG